MPDESDEESRRWSEAVDLAHGITDAGRLRRRRNRVFLLLVALIVLSWLAGVVLAVLLPTSVGDGSRDVPDSRVVGGLVVEAVGFAVLIGGFVWARRTGRYVTRWRSIAAPLSRGQRRQAQRMIAGKEQVRPDRREYLLALAEQNRRTTEGIVPLYGAILLINSFTLFVDPKPFQVVLFVLVMALFAFAAVQLATLYRRSGRFLDRNGMEPAVAPSSP